ncbi:hypothetical protein GCM10023328_37430 [Modestobacter marinus]|uniref:Septum formation initiator n=1 Tax=Modestobacter marinus TaxID=477641 RepID=A0A846LTG0_9ACTN|nr:hypothetical protein [Modestobacter marinus]NIH69612.1 hypothetical protein [Modestobacter marinus]GGL75261.1 hypothetical protein GCM10011589_34120 [Modestobacter marinus]
MSQPARSAPRSSSPRSSTPRTPTPRTPHGSTARTGATRAGTPRTTTARTARATGRATTGPVHVPRPALPRRSGPVPSGPQLRLVPPSRPIPARAPRGNRRALLRGRRAPFVVVLVALLVGTTLGLLLLNTAIAVDSLQATEQRVAMAEQAKDVARLEQQVIAADTAAELARAAAAVGLVPPGDAAHLVLQPDGSSVLLGSATPATPPVEPEATDPAAGGTGTAPSTAADAPADAESTTTPTDPEPTDPASPTPGD